jgi:hypothetical protein
MSFRQITDFGCCAAIQAFKGLSGKVKINMGIDFSDGVERSICPFQSWIYKSQKLKT